MAGPKGEFVQKANAICVQLSKDVADLKIDVSASEGSVAEKAPAIDQSAGLLDKAVADMKALPQPPGDEATLNGFYDQLTQAAALQRQQAQAAKGNDLQGIADIQKQLTALGTQANAAMASYGLDDCAR